MINVIINRTKWQLIAISQAFENKYGRSLLEFVVSEMTTMLGTLATGGNTGLSKLLSYRIMLQPERDAAFLRDFSNGMSLDDDNFIEIITTRTNIELKLAMDVYKAEYKHDLVEIVKSKASYKNYRDFVLKILECSHDEDYHALSEDVARAYALELYDAGAGRTLGVDPEPFIRILGNINDVQFDSINQYYRDNCLLKDIQSKLGGAFQAAVLARCQNKYDYLAGRLDKSFKGNFSIDKDGVTRIIGSLRRAEGIKLREAFDRGLKYNKTLEQYIKATIGKGNYQKALLDLINVDNLKLSSMNPLGNERELEDDEKEAENEGERQKKLVEINYSVEKTIQRGETLIRARHRSKFGSLLSNTLSAGSNTTSNNNGNDDENNDVNMISRKSDSSRLGSGGLSTSDVVLSDNSTSNKPLTAAEEVVDEFEDEIPSYSWDAIRGRFYDGARLAKELRDAQQATKDMVLLKERAADEIVAAKEIYLSIVKTSTETEAWIRIYTNQLKAIKEYIANNKNLAINSTATSKKKK